VHLCRGAGKMLSNRHIYSDSALICMVISTVIGGYHQSMLISEWYKDQDKNSSISRIGRLSSIVIFSSKLSERCKSRRRKVFASYVAFILFFGLYLYLN